MKREISRRWIKATTPEPPGDVAWISAALQSVPMLLVTLFGTNNNTSYSFPRTLLLFRSSQSPQFARTKMAAETIGWIYPLSTKTPALQARGAKFKPTRSNSRQLEPSGWSDDTQLHPSWKLGWSWLEWEVPFGRPRLNLSLLRVINFKIPQQPHQKYNIIQYEELGFW